MSTRILRIVCVASASCLAAGGLWAQENDAGFPGEAVRGEPLLTQDQAFSNCLELPWGRELGTLSAVKLSGQCSVTETGEIGTTGGHTWWWAIYRHESVRGPDPDTPPGDRTIFPDTILVDELVVFAGSPSGGRVEAVWHDRAQRRLQRIRPPRSHGELLVHRLCLNGTGGCLDHPYRMTVDGLVEGLRPRYLEQIRERLPAGWSTAKGIWIDPARGVAEAVVHLPGDANCCASLRVEARLAIEGDAVTTDSIALEPDSASSTWSVLPGERFGPVDATTSEEDLRRRLGSSVVTPSEVYLAEGFCTSGTHLFPGEPYELQIAWADSARTRPAFVRVYEPGEGWRTPRGVGIGTTVAELEALLGEPMTFGGLGWDYGGGASWQEHRGLLGLVLSIDPSSDSRLGDLASADPRVGELFGDRTVRSDHPIVRKITIHVSQMGVTWAAPFDERDCETVGPLWAQLLSPGHHLDLHP